MKIAIFAIHGIGNNGPDFANEFVTLLESQTKDLTNVELKVFPCSWKDLVRTTEDQLDSKIVNLGWKTLRMFMIEFVGDAVAYQLSDTTNDVYSAIHQRVDSVLSEASDWLGDDGVLLWIGHSLGTIITNNFIWDVQNKDSDGNKYYTASLKSQKALQSLKTLFTIGSPILVWSLANTGGGEPINVSKWLNIYSDYDVIGYPIKKINQAYAKDDRIIDIELNVGGLISKYFPTSHMYYFTNEKFVNIIVNECNRMQNKL